MKQRNTTTVGRVGFAAIPGLALGLGIALGLAVPALWAPPAPAQDDCCDALIEGVRKDVNGIGDQVIQMRTKLKVLSLQSCCRNHVRAIQVGARSMSLEVSQLRMAAEKARDLPRVKLSQALVAEGHRLDAAVADLSSAQDNSAAVEALSGIAGVLDSMAAAINQEPATTPSPLGTGR